MANVEFGTGKTVVILSIVAACFAILWPKIFYPMLTAISTKKMDSDNTNGCCDVLFESDVNAFKIMNEMCDTILNRHEEFNPKLSGAYHHRGKLDKEIISMCRKEVLNLCGIDIAEFLDKKEKLGRSYKQTLDEIRSYNISICLRQNFGINPGLLGAPRRMRIWGPTTPRHLRQERPLHFRPEMIHPALREKGRAIPQSHAAPKTAVGKDQSPRPLPMPGMRPPMGGAGHVVPPPKVGGTMTVIMPLYTIGIVIFFIYTVMKVFTKKSSENDEFKDFQSDPEFQRIVFSEDCSNGFPLKFGENGAQSKEKQFPTPQVWKSATDDSTRLGWKERYTIMSAITGLLTEVDQQLNRAGDTQTQYNTDLKENKNSEGAFKAKIVKKTELDQPEVVNAELSHSQNNQAEVEEATPKVKVVGLEMMAKCEGGQKWSRPATPNLGIGSHGRQTTPIPPPDGPEPQNIFLEGALPQQSQLLVSDSKTQAFTVEDESVPDPPVILSSKMTLSLINLDSALEEDNNCPDQSQCQNQSAEVKSDDDNLETADSTLFDVDSELIDESGQLEIEEEAESENEYHKLNEMKEDESTNYSTATMSGRAEVELETELEETAADVSNFDATEDQVPIEPSQDPNVLGDH